MSDIPIGSPPVPPGRHAAPSGWYPDPVNAAQERYWDGWQWSRNTRPSDGASMPPTGSPSYPGYAPPPGAQPPGTQPPGTQPPGTQPPGTQPPGQPYGPYGHPYDQQPYGSLPYGPAAQPTPPTGQYPANYRPVGARPRLLTADGVPVSGWWWRVLAMTIDSLIVGVVAALLSAPIYARMFGRLSEYLNEAVQAAEAGLPPPPQPAPQTYLPFTDQLILTLVILVVETAYIVAFLRWKSATPGKLACGLRVVPVDYGRFPGPLPWNTIVVRTAVWVLPTLSAFLLLFRLIDVLFPLWQPKRQALHDLAAKTQVIKIR